MTDRLQSRASSGKNRIRLGVVLHVMPVLLVLTALGCSSSDERATLGEAATAEGGGAGGLVDGFYAVSWESTDPDTVANLGPTHLVLPYYRTFIATVESTPALTYVAVDTSGAVPLVLEGPPEAEPDGSGRLLLSVRLDERSAAKFEEFTALHLGERVAIVLDREVVTIHKIRSVIEGGRVQITRCDDNACEILFAKLTDP